MGKYFKNFEEEMEQSRQKFLDEMYGLKKADTDKREGDIVATEPSYTKEFRNVEQSQITINGVNMKFKVLDIGLEKDGVKLPHFVRRVDLSPPGSIQLVQEHTKFKEALAKGEQ